MCQPIHHRFEHPTDGPSHHGRLASRWQWTAGASALFTFVCVVLALGAAPVRATVLYEASGGWNLAGGGNTGLLKQDHARLVINAPASTPAGLDPRIGGAALRLLGLHSGQHDTWSLPEGGWTLTKKGFGYLDRTHASGPVTSAVLGRGRIVVTAKGAAMAFALRGTGPQQSIAVAIVFPRHAPPTAVCAEFPGTQGAVKTDDPARGVFVASKANPPPTCRAL